MSGGSLNHLSGYIDDAVDKIKEHINGEEVDECEVENYIREYDLDKEESKYLREHNHTMPNPYGYSKETLRELEYGLKLLEKAAIYAHRMEWFFSGDDGEESFHERLHEDLEKLKKEEDE